MKSYDIFSNPHIAYTIGRCDIYDNHKTVLTFRKEGFRPKFSQKDQPRYVGGIVWETENQAKTYLDIMCDPAYAVYKILLPADFNKCIVPGSYDYMRGSRLLYDALILRTLLLIYVFRCSDGNGAKESIKRFRSI
jgi:hypothetical protein